MFFYFTITATANAEFTKLQNQYWTFDVNRIVNTTLNQTFISYKNVSYDNSTRCKYITEDFVSFVSQNFIAY